MDVPRSEHDDDTGRVPRATVPTPVVQRRGASLERRLPIVMTALLAAVMAASLALTYGTLTRSAEEAARERLERTAREIANSVRTSTEPRIQALEAAAADSEVVRALRAGVPVRRTPRALGELQAPADSMLAVELWSTSGERVMRLGPPEGGETPGEPGAPLAWSPAQATRPRSGDRVAFGKLYPERGRMHFWITVPVMDGARVAGYLSQQRRVGGARNASQTLQGLIGQEVTLFLLNDDRTQWTLAPGDPAQPPARVDTGLSGVRHDRPGVGELLAVKADIRGTPWSVVLETPVRAVHARSRSTLVTLALMSGALVLMGALLAWLLSRRITKPLAQVTVAAEGIARGEFSRRVEVRGGDELARLAASFNRMAGQIDQSRQELERRMSEAEVARTEAEEARHRADEANRAKSHFLATMSHELRTPLNAIAGYTDLISMGIYGPVSDQQQEALSRINRSQTHLLRLINDVLHFVKLTAGQVPYSVAPMPLAPALAELEDLVAPQMRAKRLNFHIGPVDPQLHVGADRDKLQQIVLNLLSNAVKFTPEGGSIIIAVREQVSQALVEVRDTGIGIPTDRLDDVFDAFVQVDRAFHRPSEGIGLGLAISRDLARGMGGDLTVSSEVDRGTTFTLMLPVASPSSQSRSGRSAGKVTA